MEYLFHYNGVFCEQDFMKDILPVGINIGLDCINQPDKRGNNQILKTLMVAHWGPQGRQMKKSFSYKIFTELY
jgi:hypothetical protein